MPHLSLMLGRRLLLLAATAVVLVACGGDSNAGVPDAELFAVNGARHPAVHPADTAVWAGFGFGSAQGTGSVVLTAGGEARSAEVVQWADGQIRAAIPPDVEPGFTWVTAQGDSLGPLELFVVPRTGYEPAVHTWVADAAPPVATRDGAAAGIRFPDGATLSSAIVLTGGRFADGTLNRGTYLAALSADGRITSWREASDTIVPAGRWLHAMAGADRTNTPVQDVASVAYMLGGVDSAGRVLADVLGLGLSADGVYSLWTPMAPLPDRRAGSASVVAFGKLYAIGGFRSDSLATREVFYATVLPNGTLNGWLIGPPLPEDRAFAAAVVAGSSLYVVGGQRGLVSLDSLPPSSQLTNTVYRIPLSPLSGAFLDSVWTQVPATLLRARARAAAALVDDAIVVTGGVYEGMPSSGETEFAPLSAGVLGAFELSPSATLASAAGGPVLGAAAPLTWSGNGIARITLIGGSVGAVPAAQAWSQ